ncbi:hypothetical protein [Vitiosangium sp. GDMCC 1.1324]|uniref:hypothetical protein n=1 Tax=Vitiosangium sp. (strain GDMCC 1.1324) TaxID=2138576 RepID=UPI000D380E69|nr:hypothetical protein [Vitiosangium sp. GDMCC 1.1324]PTL84735.1 hypothetical protein DAT35_06630 [Vitiosangium sp. GDMCC 1.1324]
MKQLWKKSLVVGLAAVSAAGCGEPKDDNTTPPPQGQTIEVAANITADTTWESANTYVLKQHVFVEGGTLTIQPGTKVLGETGTSLVITRNAKINAVGTKDKPIVFTSSKEPGQRKSSDWGGVILLGKAKLNVPDQFIEGFPTGDERLKYGGGEANVGDDTHDCGKLKYARIEFAGFKIATDKEINSLTLGACGTKTEVEYIQTLRGSDDGVEVFGGTVNLKHILVSLAEDDGLDWDFGYRGKVQYLIVQQGPEIGNNGIEADNYEKGNDNLPRSAPEIWNATFIGRGAGGVEKSIGMTLRRGTAGKLNNVIVQDFADGAIDINGTSSAQQFRDGALSIKNSLFWNLKGSNTALPAETDNDGGLDEAAELTASSTNNRFADPKLAAAANVKAPNFKPQAESAALLTTNAAVPPTDGFFEKAQFVGAMGTDDWTAGWTAFPEN